MNRLVLSIGTFLLMAFISPASAEKPADPWQEMTQILKKISQPKFKNKTYLITDFGAKEGVEDYTSNVINQVICYCNSKGGGKVIVPRDIFYTGPITLKRNSRRTGKRKNMVALERPYQLWLAKRYDFAGMERKR